MFLEFINVTSYGSGSKKIIEISYSFMGSVLYNCPGYWDEKMDWHPGNFYAEDAILDDLIEKRMKKSI